MNYTKIKKYDIANGPGVRVSLFVSGCDFHCKGCFNEESWDKNAGDTFTEENINEIIESLRPEHITGLSILGGDPLMPYNRFSVSCIINKVREVYGDTKDIWLWTGFIYEDLLKILEQDNFPYLDFILSNIDVLVDGPFIESKKDLSLKWRGSSNQNINYLK